MKDKDWELLYELYKTPNITKVANKLYMTQPTLTKRLQQIEAEFNMQIVNRSTKGVEFTPEGEFLAKRAEKYMTFMEELYRELKSFREETGKTIVIGSSYTFSKTRLPELLFSYSQISPNVKFEIVNEQSDVLYRRLLDKTVDMAFVRNDFDGTAERILIERSCGYVVSKEPVTVEALSSLPCIEYRTNGKTMELFDRWWFQHHNTERRKGMNAGYRDFVWDFVQKGLGYTLCFAPDPVVEELHLSLLPMIYTDGTPVGRNTWFTYQKEREKETESGRFIGFVKEYFKSKS